MSLLGSQLDAFLSVVKCKTVHAAAEDLHLTQTAVTQRIRALETKLKTTLFTRSRRGMALTSEGEALLHYCQAAKQLEGQALAQIQGNAIETSVDICITGASSVMRSRIIPSCLVIAKKFPQLRFKFKMTDVERRHKTLKEGRADLAVLEPKDVAAEMESKVLQAEEYVLAAPYAWKDRSLKDIVQNESIIDFEPADNTTMQYLMAFNLQQLAKPDRHFANRTDAVADLITAEMGYSTLTREYAEPFVESKQLTILNNDKAFSNPLMLCWYERPEPPAYFAALIEAIQ